MITNSNRSGSVKVKVGEKDVSPPTRPQDEVRSGKLSEGRKAPQKEKFGSAQRQKIVSLNGQLELVDAN